MDFETELALQFIDINPSDENLTYYSTVKAAKSFLLSKNLAEEVEIEVIRGPFAELELRLNEQEDEEQKVMIERPVEFDEDNHVKF